MKEIEKSHNLLVTGAFSETAIICSQDGEIISWIGEKRNISEKFSDFCVVIQSMGEKITDSFKKGNSNFTVFASSDKYIVVYPLEDHYMVAFVDGKRGIEFLENLI